MKEMELLNSLLRRGRRRWLNFVCGFDFDFLFVCV